MQTANAVSLSERGEIISLSLGNILDKKQLFWGYFGISVCCLFPILTLILLLIPQVEWDVTLVSLMSVCDIGAFAFLSVLIFVLIKDKKIVETVKPWLDDAVEIESFSKKVGEIRLGIQPKSTKIQVKFTWQGTHYIRESTVKLFGGQEGYAGWFNKYADRKVRILYSPKYDEVILLKD